MKRFVLLSMLLAATTFAATIRDATSGTPAGVGPQGLRVTLAADGGTGAPVMSGGPVGGGRGPNVMGVGLQRLAIEEDDLLFYDPVDGTTMNSNLWGGSSTTMTVTQTVANGIRLNAGSSTATTTNVLVISNQPMPYTMESSLACRWRFRMSNAGQLNQQVEVGLGDVVTTAAPTAGSFFRWTNAGTFVAVVSQNSTEVASASLTAPTANVFHNGMIVKHSNDTEFFIDDVLVATVLGATTDPNTWDDARPNFFMRNLIAGSSPGAAPLYDQGATVCYGTIAAPRDYLQQLAVIGRGAYQSPTATTSFGQITNWTNNAAPAAAAVCSNTTAPATTLGGLVQITPTTTANNDCELFAYTVPADVQLLVTSVWCDSVNLGAAQPASVLNLLMAVGVNGSADSLATADALGPPATAWQTRRIGVGTMRYASAAAIGDVPTANTMSAPHVFSPPLVVDGTRRFHIFARTMQTQTATASQVLYFNCGVSGVFQ